MHIDECVLMELCHETLEEDIVYEEEEMKHLGKVSQEVSQMFDFDELVSKLLNYKLCGDAYDYIDYSLDSLKRIYKVNVGLWNARMFEIEETSVFPPIFIDIFTDVTAYHIQKHPEKEEHLKQGFLQLLKFIEDNKYSE